MILKIHPAAKKIDQNCDVSCPKKTGPDTMQSSCGWLGRSSNAKTAWNSKKFVTYQPTDTAWCTVACPRLKK